MNGRKQDVLFEDEIFTDPRTGVEVVSTRSFSVWADANKKDLIASVEGVAAVYTNQPYATKYCIYIDQRYDMEFVKREIEAIILIGDAS